MICSYMPVVLSNKKYVSWSCWRYNTYCTHHDYFHWYSTLSHYQSLATISSILIHSWFAIYKLDMLIAWSPSCHGFFKFFSPVALERPCCAEECPRGRWSAVFGASLCAGCPAGRVSQSIGVAALSGCAYSHYRKMAQLTVNIYDIYNIYII